MGKFYSVKQRRKQPEIFYVTAIVFVDKFPNLRADQNAPDFLAQWQKSHKIGVVGVCEGSSHVRSVGVNSLLPAAATLTPKARVSIQFIYVIYFN